MVYARYDRDEEWRREMTQRQAKSVLQTVVRFLFRNGLAVFLGIALAALHVYWYEWRFYAVLIPALILANLKAQYS